MPFDPAVELLGSGPAYPLQAAPSGLPDLVVAEGEAAVESAFRLLLRTETRELPHDPTLGLAFRRFVHNKMDNRLREEVFNAINGSLMDGEPRVRNVASQVDFPIQGTLADIEVSYEIITTQVPNNGVLDSGVGSDTVLEITEE